MSRRADTISDKIEPELRTPPPRKVRRRAPSALRSAALSGVAGVVINLQTPLSFLFLAPTLFGLSLFYRLIKLVSEVMSSRGGPSPKPLTDALPLLIVTLIWNAVALGMAWEGFVKPLIYRRLVVYGQPAVARVTAVTLRSKTCSISYLFYPEKGFALIGTAEVQRDDWVDGRKLNAEITVLFFRRNPKWNIPYRHSGYEVIAD